MKTIVYHILLLNFVVFSCSDWKEYPPQVEVSENSMFQNNKLLESTIFPKNISAFYYDNGTYHITKTWFVGTATGSIYSSSDNGMTWRKNADLSINDKINFFLFYDQGSKFYLIAGTNKGGYISTDNGLSWREALGRQNESGGFRRLMCGETFFVAYTVIGIRFYGTDGKHNVFYSNNNGVLFNGNYEKYPIPDSYLQDYKSSFANIYIYNGVSHSCIMVDKDTTIFNENLELFSPIYYQKTNRFYFAATKKGVLRSSDNGKTWAMIGLQNKRVNCLAFYSGSSYLNYQLFAGTDEGLYISTNDGISWQKTNFVETEDAIKTFKLIEDKLYFVTGSGDTFFLRLENFNNSQTSSGSTGITYTPVLYLPANNTICDSYPVLKWVQIDKIGSVLYKLQISQDSLFSNPEIFKSVYENNFKTESSSFIEKNKKYFWRVRSVKIGMQSNWSEVFSFTIK